MTQHITQIDVLNINITFVTKCDKKNLEQIITAKAPYKRQYARIIFYQDLSQ